MNSVRGGMLVAHLRFTGRNAILAAVRLLRLLDRRARAEMHGNAVAQFLARFVVSAVVERLGEQFDERVLQFRQLNAVLWPLRTGNTWLNVGEVKFQIDAVIDLA